MYPSREGPELGKNSVGMADKNLRIVDGREDIGLFANAAPGGVGFHHAFHHAKVAAGLDVAVFEEAVADDHRSFFGVDGDGDGGAVVHAGPEDANAGLHLFFVGQQAHLVPPLVLQVVIHVRRHAQVAWNVEVVERRLEILDPAAAGDGNGGVAEHGDVGGGVSLQRRDQDQRDVLWSKALRAENVLRKLRLGAHDLGLGVAKEAEPGLVDHGEILGGAGVDEDVLAAALHEI